MTVAELIEKLRQAEVAVAAIDRAIATDPALKQKASFAWPSIHDAHNSLLDAIEELRHTAKLESVK